MSGIEEVIARSRAKGGFKKKGQFTLASEKARLKVSEFALPDPFLYCLELIQSAVALRAVYLDVATNESSFILSVEGMFYTRRDLERMFDYLITGIKDDHSRAYRRLAIGVAAALSLPRSAVVIESGDGTLEGSTRFELSDLMAKAVIGMPRQSIEGAFIKVTHARFDNVITECSMEENVILERCKHLPVILFLNGETPFGYEFSRAIKLHGYRYGVSFDDGDLYGGLAIDDDDSPKFFQDVRILTNGIEIASLASPNVFSPGQIPDEVVERVRADLRLGIEKRIPLSVVGVVTYDRLNKTASQYDIVRDERVAELMERLKPFVNQLLMQAGVCDENRLDYLVDRSVSIPGPWGTPYVFDIQKEPFPITASFCIDTRPDNTAEIKTYLVRETADGSLKLIQYFKDKFPIPTVWRVTFCGNFASALNLPRRGDEGFAVDNAVTLTSKMRCLLGNAVKARFGLIQEHLDAEWAKWQNKQVKEKKRAVASATPQVQWDPLMQAILSIAEETSKKAAVESPATLGKETAPASNITAATVALASDIKQQISDLVQMREALFKTDDGATDTGPSIPKVPTGAVHIRPVAVTDQPVSTASTPTPSDSGEPPSQRLTMPTVEEVSQQLRQSEGGERDLILCSLLHRILDADSANRHFFQCFNGRVEIVKNRTVDSPAWVEMRHLHGKSKYNSPVFINRAHPLISRWLEECAKNPVQVYAIALLAESAIRRQCLSSPDIQPSLSNRSGLCRAIVRCL